MKKTVIIFLLFIGQLTYCQNYKFGKVSEEELLETQHPEYPEATAAILYKKQKIMFDYIQGKGFIQSTEIQERIKIYNKEGFDYATKMISLYDGASSASSEKLIGLKAYTYNIEGGKIIKDKLKNSDVFDEDTNKYRKTTKFTMPNLKEGCVIELEYTIESQLFSIDDIAFQQMIPTKNFELSLNTPEYLIYKTFLNPRATYIPQLTETKKRRSVTITSRERSQSRGGGLANYSSSKIDFNDNVVEANLSNIPPLKDENYVDNLANYQSRLLVELERIELPNQPIEYLSTTWEKVTNTIYDDSDFGDQLSKNNYFKKDLETLMSSKPTDDKIEKVSMILDFVKSKVKWNEYYGYTAEQGVSKAYKDGVGNSADINLMLTSMLRYAGMDANPVLVSTKNNGIPLVPTRSGFNYVISAVNVDGKIILIDATRKHGTIDILPTNTLNWLGRLIKEDGSSDWINLIPEVSSSEMVSLNAKLETDLSINGKIRHQYTNYQANRLRNKYDGYGDEKVIETLEKNKGLIEISDLNLSQINEVDKPVLLSYDFNIDEAIEDVGGDLYLKPMLFLASKENPFKQDTRIYPIDFVYPISDKYMVNMMIPEGYELDVLPESVKYQFNGSDGVFTYMANKNGSYIQFVITFELNKTLILPTEYKQFKEFYQLMIEKQNEQIVLKKI
ncbi:DUF3857 domain-containing protein [Meridianimaribacter flavus]|uniref:Transglutaminase superfamily protein n=1 Tax=Meridianimaribacter flavus TaxID=571115 RepID=A0ABY2G3R8_9FLAO|nr:DUF3857 domain-containing protein [Meridianimaribacter flavus]TDY10144.1 transglutaminase superfamily protein [Meridianimaribacter flavus]